MANPLHQFVSSNGDVNLTSSVLVFNEANAGAITRWVTVRIEVGDGVKNLGGAADTTLTFIVQRSSKFVSKVELVVPTGYTRVSQDSEPITWKPGESISVYLQSNQSDSDVDVTVEAIDIAPLQPTTSGRAVTVESDGMAHVDIKEVAGASVSGVSDFKLTPTEVWNHGSRTLSAFSFDVGVNASSVRSAVGLAAANLDTQLSGINSKTTNLPASPAASSDVTAVPQAVWEYATRTLSGFSHEVTVGVNNDKAGYGLSTSERSALAIAIESALINEGDGQQLIDAIIQVINTSLDVPSLELAAIANAVRNELATELARIDVTVSSRAAPGAQMDLVNAPNATALSAIQNGLATSAGVEARTLLASQYSQFNAVNDAVNIGKVAGIGVAGIADFHAASPDLSGLAEKSDLPTNFSSLGITEAGTLSRVALVDVTTTNSDMRGTDSAATPGAAMSLTTAERNTLATTIEGALLNDGDGQQLMAAIVQNINTNLDVSATELSAISASVVSALSTWLNRIDTTISSRAAPGAQMDLVNSPNSTAVSAIKSGLATSSDVSGVPAAVDTVLTDSHGAGSWASADQSGSGAYSVSITVQDSGAVAINGATVRLSEVGGASVFTATTDSNGLASFSVDAASYTVSITKPMYSFTPATLAVSANTSQTYSLTTVQFTVPSSPTLCAVSVLCLTKAGAAEQGAIVNFQLVRAPAGATGYAASKAIQTATSAANGYLQFDAIRGARYKIWREGQAEDLRVSYSIPTDEDVVSLPAFIGP